MSTFRRRLMIRGGEKTIKPYMHFEALENGLTISLSRNSIEYSLDGRTWVTLPANTASPAINAGEKIYFKGELSPKSSVGIGTLTLSKRCNAGGNAMSLLFGDDFENQYSLSGKKYAFYALFNGCTNLEGVSDDFLPATTLADYCYDTMFNKCTSLVKGCTLPATSLAPYCYMDMFYNCSSLESAPELPATTLANYCYNNMFANCTSLIIAPELPATSLAPYCYTNMFHSCTSLKVASELPATTLATSCYRAMFYGCISLEVAPELPATRLVFNCYASMFYNCLSINYIKALFTSSPGASYTVTWVYGVASSGTFVKNKNATWNVRGVDGIPSGWTVITE